MDKKKAAFPVWLGIATTWFGMHCGSGFATGTQYTIYYSAYGWMAIFTPLITWTLMAVSFYFIFEYTRREKLQTYRDYAEKVYIRKLSGLFIILLDLWSLFAQILGESGILAGSGALFEQMGLNYWIGVLAAGAVVLCAVIFGATIVMKVSTALTMGLVVCIAILGVVGCAANFDNFKAVLGQRMFPEGKTFLDALKGSFTYAGVQVGSMFALIPLANGLASKKETSKAAFGGAALNVAMLMILGLVMIANYPKLNSEVLPVLAALESLGVPALTWIYRIMLFLALVSTGIGCGFAMHGEFDANTAIQLVQELDKYNCTYFEEPVSCLCPEMTTAVSKACKTPIATGERIPTRWGFKPFLENRSIRVAQPDLGIVGGITEIKKVADLARLYDIGVQIHNFCSPILCAATLHVETAITNFVYHEDIMWTRKPYFWKLGTRELAPVNGYYTAPDAPGLGVELSDYALKYATITTIK